MKKTRTPKGPISLGLKKRVKNKSTINDTRHKAKEKRLRI